MPTATNRSRLAIYAIATTSLCPRPSSRQRGPRLHIKAFRVAVEKVLNPEMRGRQLAAQTRHRAAAHARHAPPRAHPESRSESIDVRIQQEDTVLNPHSRGSSDRSGSCMHDLSGNESGARTGRDWAGDAPVTPRDGLARARAHGRPCVRHA